MEQAEATVLEAEAAPEIAGRVTIEWPNAAESGPGPLKGWGAVVRDADTGEPLRTLDVTVTAPALRHVPGGTDPVVFADVTHPAGEDGRVLDRDYGPAGHWNRDIGATAVRRYEVTRMSEIPPVEPWTSTVTRAGLAEFLHRVRADGGTVEALRLTAGDMKELVHGAGPWGAGFTCTEDGVTRPERVATTRVTSVQDFAADGAEIPVILAPDSEKASARVRYGPDGTPAQTIAVSA